VPLHSVVVRDFSFLFEFWTKISPFFLFCPLLFLHKKLKTDWLTTRGDIWNIFVF
jgi:hypothetical protein